jgi:hypothetical protein
MATYKNMNDHPKPATQDNFVAAGYIDGNFTLAIGPIRIALSKEEKEITLDTWNKLENGIDPTA